MKSQSAVSGAQPLNVTEGEKKIINAELWQACAGPLVNLPVAGTHVVYFPQGHSEQVAASMRKDMNAQVPSYPNLPAKLLCLLHSVTLHADPETDEVYAQMTLQPVPSFDKDALLRSDLSMKAHKPQTEFFCKTLTASDTSTHGGFSVPRRSAEKIFPPLDFAMQPPAQELVARDLHDNVWTFRHIYRGQPKRHLLTTGWSLVVGGKRLFAGDSVLFIRDEKQHLLLGIRRANRQPTNLSSSVLSSDSMHIGILAAAAHAAANNSPFTIFYNPRTSPSEFVIPLAKYYKAVCSNQISLGMRFRMMFETEDSGTRRYMGTITGISDLDPVRWKNSQWRNLQVGWDESTTGEKRNRVSVWEIEPVTAPFFMCPTPPFFRTKRPRQPGMPDDDSSDIDSMFRRTMPWLGDDYGMKDPQAAPGLSLVQWMNMQNPTLANSMQPNYLNSLSGSVLQNFTSSDISRQFGQIPQQNSMQLNAQLQNLSASIQNPVNSNFQSQQFTEVTQSPRQNLTSQHLPTSQLQSQIMQTQNPIVAQNVLQQQQSLLNQQYLKNISQSPQKQQQQQQPNPNQSLPQNLLPTQPDHTNQQFHMSENQIQLQLLHKLHQQQQSLLAQQSSTQQPRLPDQSKNLQETPSNFSRSVSTSDASQTTHGISQMRNNNQTNLQFPPQPQQQGVLPQYSGNMGNFFNPLSGQFAAASSSLVTGAAGGGPSAVTDDNPSRSTSPSTNNCPSTVQSMVNGRGNDIAQSSSALLNPTGLENFSSNPYSVKDLNPTKMDLKPVSKSQNQGLFASQIFMNPVGTKIDYLDSSSSATSVLSQNEAQVPHPNNTMSFNSQPMLFRDASNDIGEVLGDSRNNVSNIENELGMSMIQDQLITKNMVGSDKDFSSGLGMLPSYENPKEAQNELFSSMVSESFGVQDMGFNSIDSTLNEGNMVNQGSWAPTQVPKTRSYTKVYKRGAVGRVIDITRYTGYDELKQDLARRFGIEGQLEDQQRVGWKLVYVDHENDVLLVGDDPWEEFVSCVRCIKILSPQEVQKMSLDGDFGNSVLPNQACSSSDNGVN